MDLFVPGEGSESVPVISQVSVVSNQPGPAVLHNPRLEVAENVPGRRRDLQAVSVLQALPHLGLLQQDAGRGSVPGDDEPQLLPLLFLIDVHQDLPPLPGHLLELVDGQSVQKLVGCSLSEMTGLIRMGLLTNQGRRKTDEEPLRCVPTKALDSRARRESLSAGPSCRG